MSWRTIRSGVFGPVERVVAVYQVGPPVPYMPFSGFKVKVVERPDGTFLAVANVALRDAHGHPDWTAGLGDDADQALADCLDQFAVQLDAQRTWSAADFVWADPHEF